MITTWMEVVLWQIPVRNSIERLSSRMPRGKVSKLREIEITKKSDPGQLARNPDYD